MCPPSGTIHRDPHEPGWGWCRPAGRLESSQPINRHRVFWIKVPLEPELSLPVYDRKVVHTHIDSMQRTYAGVAFDFTFNHAHEKLIAEQIQHYIERIQESQREAHARSLESGDSSD